MGGLERVIARQEEMPERNNTQQYTFEKCV